MEIQEGLMVLVLVMSRLNKRVLAEDRMICQIEFGLTTEEVLGSSILSELIKPRSQTAREHVLNPPSSKQ